MGTSEPTGEVLGGLEGRLFGLKSQHGPHFEAHNGARSTRLPRPIGAADPVGFEAGLGPN